MCNSCNSMWSDNNMWWLIIILAIVLIWCCCGSNNGSSCGNTCYNPCVPHDDCCSGGCNPCR